MAPIVLLVSKIPTGQKFEYVGWPVAPAPNDGWLTPQQCADHFQLSRETILRMVRSKKIPYLRLPGAGRLYRFNRQAIERWAEARTIGRDAKRP